MSRVMIYAYTAHNLGDDLFIHILCTRYPNVKFLCYAPNRYKKTFAYLPNLEIIPSDQLLNKLAHKALSTFGLKYYLREKKARTCKVGVYIGGSIFMEQPGWETEISNIKSMKASHSHFLIIGANFGPYQSVHFSKRHEQLFEGVTDICFRDQKSERLFNHLPNVRRAADVVFQLQSTFNQKKFKEQILISVIYPSVRDSLHSYDSSYFQAIATICGAFIERGYKVLLMAFCKQEKDDKAIQEIMTLIPAKYHDQLDTYFYSTNLLEAIAKIHESSAVIATRFHAMIVGWVMGKPVFPIVYSNKMKTVLDDIHYTGAYSTVQNIQKEDLNKLVDILLHQPPIDMTQMRIEASGQFNKLDELLR